MKLFKKNDKSEKNIDVQDTKEFWDRDDVVYNDTANIHDNYDVTTDGMIEVINEWCGEYNVSVGSTILEAGCGGGRILMIWNECNNRYNWQFTLEGIDHSPKAVAVTKQRLPHVNVNIIGMEELNVKNRYDIIYTHTALQHNSGWKQNEIYPKLHKALKPNGLLYLINEKTFSTWEDGEITSPFYSDDRNSAGTVSWWIQRISSFGFELLEYHKSSYTLRRL